MTEPVVQYTCSKCRLSFSTKEACEEHIKQHKLDVPCRDILLEFDLRLGEWRWIITNSIKWLPLSSVIRIMAEYSEDTNTRSWYANHVPEARLGEAKAKIHHEAQLWMRKMRSKLTRQLQP